MSVSRCSPLSRMAWKADCCQAGLPLQNLSIAQNRIQRSSDFVTHVGQKTAFGLIGFHREHLRMFRLAASIIECPIDFQ